MHIRPIERRDAEETRAIYNAAVQAELANLDHMARTAEEHLEWVDAHFGSYPALVAEADSGSIIGFASVGPFRTRTGYTTTVENSIYVHDAARGQGVGSALLSALCDRARDMGFHCIIARIVEGNDGSVALHERCGFTLVGVEREVGRKRGRWLDVTVMQRLL